MVDRGNNFSCDMAELGGAGCQSLASLDSTIFFESFSDQLLIRKRHPKLVKILSFSGAFFIMTSASTIFSSSARELELAQPMPHPGHGGGPLTTNLAESWGVKPESDCHIL